MTSFRFAYALISLPLILSALPTHAQEEGAGTGAVVQTEEEMRWENRQERAEGFRNPAFRIRKKIQAFTAQRESRQAKTRQHRESCREEIRRANRDNKVSVLLRCYRSELTINLETLRKRKQIIEELVGISEEQKTATLNALDSLTDAINAIIAGIDSGVYQTEKELIEAKQNLHDRYRTAYWWSLTRMRADKMLTWISHLLTRMDTMVAEGVPSSVLEHFSTASECLSEAERLYAEVLAEEGYEGSKEKIRQAQSTLKSCIPSLRGAIKAKRDGEIPVTEESSEAQGKSQKRGLAFV